MIISTKTLGKMQLRQLTGGDLIEISKLLTTKGIDDRMFVLRSLHLQVESPSISVTALSKLHDDEVVKIAMKFVANESHVFKYYKDTGRLYADFRNAIREYQVQHIMKRLALSPGLMTATKKLNALDNTLVAAARQALDKYMDFHEMIQKDSRKFEELLESNVNLPRVTPLTFSPALELATRQLKQFDKQFAMIAQQAVDSNRNVIQSALAGIPNISKAMSKIMAGMSTPYFGIAEQYTKMAQMAISHLKPQMEYFQDWINGHQKIFYPIWQSWDEIEKKNKIEEKQAARILRKYKWFICPSMPVSAIQAILSVAKKKGRKDADINKLFIDHFARDNWSTLESMVTDWEKNPLFKPRMPILNNCVKVLQSADRNGANAAAVILPTLIAQIDGILTDYLERHGVPFKTMYDDFVQGGKTKKHGRKSQFKANVPNALTEDLNDLAMDMFLNVLFQRSQRGKPLATPFNFNRHKIMHGESVHYGRKDYVVRAFMVLDFLSHLK